MPEFKKIPKKFQPDGFEIIYEDIDVLVGIKEAGYLTVEAPGHKARTVFDSVNHYIRKGNFKSSKSVYVVHRLDQWTSGLMIFAKSEKVQYELKDNWKSVVKNYYCVVHGKFEKKQGLIESHLLEDEEYRIHSNDKGEGKLAQTEYQVLKETPHFSLVKVNLLTGRKNQIRVHMADAGHAIVGDRKYGKPESKKQDQLALHSCYLEFTHPFSKKRMQFKAPAPDFFRKFVDYDYDV